MNKHTRSRNILFPLLCGCLLLNSCHSPLYYSAANGNLADVKNRIQKGEDLSGKDPTGIGSLITLPFFLAASPAKSRKETSDTPRRSETNLNDSASLIGADVTPGA